MPVACLTPGTRKAAFKSTLGYYVAALWPIVPGFERYLGQSAILVPVALWTFIAILLSIPWAVAWTSDRFHYLWRAPVALLATVVPPLGIIGLASPLTGAGYLLPGASWLGLAAVAFLPGIFLSKPVWRLYPRWVGRAFAIGFCIGLVIEAPRDAQPTLGWMAVNTHFGDVGQPFRDFAAAQFIQQKAAETSARVLIFPEAVVPRWSEATETFWQQSLDRCRARGQILAIGAGLPAKPELPRGDRERVSDLKAYDFAAAIDALKQLDPQSPPGTHVSEIPNVSIKPRPAPIDNTLLVVGAESATFCQRVPVPIGMWRPFGRVSVPLRLGAPGILSIDHQRAAVLICYEQLLTFPILASMLQHPTVVVGVSNTFWVDGTTIPQYQANALRSWARLFHLPYFLATNS
jgi:hypothetical protein